MAGVWTDSGQRMGTDRWARRAARWFRADSLPDASPGAAPARAFHRRLAVNHLAAIDMNGLAADVRGVVAGQIDISRTQFGRLAAAAHGHLAAEVFEHLRVVFAERRWLQRRPDRAWRDLVDADLALDQLL